MVAMKEIGIRELKDSAPELVRRASQGERFVVTRYGKPAALLLPLADEAESPKARAWLREKQAFERQQARLLARHRGTYVAVHRGQVIDSDRDHDRLSARVWKRLRGKPFFVGRVGAPPDAVEITGFELE
jgi:prevent-host-death family protein